MSKTRPSSDGASKATRPGGSAGLRDRLGWWWQAPLGLLVLSILIVLVISIAFGATRPNTGNPPAPTSSASPRDDGLPTPIASPAPLSPAPQLSELDAEIARIEQKYGVLVGITLSQAAPRARVTQRPWHGGSLSSGPAFGTIDVALGLAVLGDGKQPSDPDYLFNRALADNSRAADDALWAFLGTPEEAAEKTQEALRSYGDWRTSVPATSTVNREAPYLDTEWTLESQARVAGAMLCDYVAVHPVLSKLNDPADDPWGLQTIPMAYAKGDWGTMGNGDTLVRQFGIMRLADSTQVGIAMAVSGQFTDPAVGQGAITELTNATRRLATGIAPPAC